MTNLINDIDRLAALGQTPIRHQPTDELERFVWQVWTLLNGVVAQADDTVWADELTTVHEALIDIVSEYRPELVEALQRELES